VSFLDRFQACSSPVPEGYLPWIVAGKPVGLVSPAFAAELAAYPEVFAVRADAALLDERLTTFAERTAAVDGVLRDLHAKGVIRGWREEPYRVGRGWHAAPLLQVERAAVPLLGVVAYGIHVNGYVREGRDIRMWLARRSPTKPLDPGKLDQIVAGGQPATLSLMDNLVKEADEEAAIPRALALRAFPTGAITYTLLRQEGLRRDVIFVYDLELPAGFTPQPRDGEVERFYLWPLEQVRDVARDTEDFKFNCAPVAIHFLIRHGVIGPEEPDYLRLLAAFRR
jgi:hypothetical protein